MLLEKGLDKEYAGITGVPEFNKAAAALAYGEDSAVLAENRVSVCAPFRWREEVGLGNRGDM